MIGQRILSRAALMVASAALLLAAAPVSADSVADFYEGKQIRVIVVSGSGGLNALYARTLGDRMGKHVPGKPNFIYQYMPGSGGMKGANYCYNIAPKDGTTLCQVLNPIALARF